MHEGSARKNQREGPSLTGVRLGSLDHGSGESWDRIRNGKDYEQGRTSMGFMRRMRQRQGLEGLPVVQSLITVAVGMESGAQMGSVTFG